MKALRRIGGGLRYMFTGKLPKSESKIIEDYFSVLCYRGTKNKGFGEDEVTRVYCLTTDFGTLISPCLQKKLELFSILEHIPSVVHFPKHLDTPDRNIYEAVFAYPHR